MDENGYVSITGRAKEMIIRGGENIYPAEIENAIRELDAVADVAVIGVPDERYGEVCAAYVRLAEGASLSYEQLREQLQGRVARYKIPAHLRLVDRLPLTPPARCRSSSCASSSSAEPAPNAKRRAMADRSAGSSPRSWARCRGRRWTARSRRSRRATSSAALELCEEMKHEWRFLHDLMAESCSASSPSSSSELGDEGVAEAWEESMRRGWKRDTEQIVDARPARDRRGAGGHLARALEQRRRARTRARFTITEDEEKFTFEMNPCGVGPAALAQRRLRGRGPLRRDRRGARLVLRARGLPALLHPLRLHERAAADPAGTGCRCTPRDPPEDFDHDPCTWYWYKDPADIPDDTGRRYGLGTGAGHESTRAARSSPAPPAGSAGRSP